MATAPNETSAEHFSREAAVWDAKPFIKELSAVAAAKLTSMGVLSEQQDVLDLGCGTGLLIDLLLPYVRIAVGIDTAPGMVEKFNEKMVAGNKSHKAVALCADIMSHPHLPALSGRPELPNTFDVVLSHMTFHHVEKVEDTVKAMASYLKPGGTIAIFDMMKTPTSHRFHGKAKHHTVHHIGGFDEKQMEGMLEAAGLRNCQAVGIHDFTKPDPDDPAQELPFKLLMATAVSAT